MTKNLSIGLCFLIAALGISALVLPSPKAGAQATVQAIEAEPQVITNVSVQTLNRATVMVSNRQKSSGGSGVILSSGPSASYILTNAHVCGVLEKEGGLISTTQGDFVVERYVKSNVHDICGIQVLKNLQINTPVANTSEYGDKVRISGHPFLLPNTVTDGYLSNSLEITLLIDVKECTEKELEENLLMCLAFNGMPIIKNYTAQTTSSMIAPGNSGSGVFNEKGELVGLAFAGIGRGISHGLIVPLEYVQFFLTKEVATLTWTESNAAKRGSEIVGQESKRSFPTKKALKSIIFPAIKSDKFEDAFNGMQELETKDK